MILKGANHYIFPDHIFCFSTEYTVLPAKSDSEVMFCLQSYHGFMIDISLVY